MNRQTLFSEDRLYRFTLWREWGDLLSQDNADSYCNFICLNPSTADETTDDPTIRRCVDFSKQWGYSAFCMTNLFAFRATKPAEMMLSKHPFGIGNDDHILRISRGANLVVVAWGNDGAYLGKGYLLRLLLQSQGIRFHHLGKNKNGEPKHPLYLPKTTRPVVW